VGQALKLIGAETSLEEDSLLNAARRRNRLGDFGDESFLIPFRMLLSSMEEEARLSPVGRFISRERLINVLGNRLRAERFFEDNPSILEQSLRPPVVITGLQRTGTTLLHRLLAADPRLRALSSWEAINPAPFLDGRATVRPRAGMTNQHRFGEDGEDRRIRIAQMSQRAVSYLAPDFFAIHPIEACGPEEDVLLLDYAFLSTVPEATLRVPRYSQWLESQDQRPAYTYMEKLLKLLLWQRPAERWLLKSPHHLEYLDVLLEVYPEARIIQTHRNPLITMASFCSMIAHGRGVFSNRVDPMEVGRQWLRKLERVIRRTIAVREARNDSVFLDVAYDDLLRNPIGVVERIYAFCEMDLSATVRQRIEEARRIHVQYRYGHHVYRLEDFGLDEPQVERAFCDYCERFGLWGEA
jgi:hypothetical protein